MPLSANNIYFFISYAIAFLVFGLIAKWYLWPAVKDHPPAPRSVRSFCTRACASMA
jgi:hypothetical protein